MFFNLRSALYIVFVITIIALKFPQWWFKNCYTSDHISAMQFMITKQHPFKYTISSRTLKNIPLGGGVSRREKNVTIISLPSLDSICKQTNCGIHQTMAHLPFYYTLTVKWICCQRSPLKNSTVGEGGNKPVAGWFVSSHENNKSNRGGWLNKGFCSSMK